MPIDQQDLYCTDLAITGNTNSNNVIDHGGNTYHGIGVRPAWIPIYVTTAFTGGNTAGTVVFQSSQYAAFNSSVTNTTIADIPLNAAVGLLACPAMPPLGQDQQYSRLTFVNPGSNYSTGNMTAFVNFDPDLVKNKAVGWTGPATS